jgi:NDP-sugar pyrophosphorylase family protein
VRPGARPASRPRPAAAPRVVGVVPAAGHASRLQPLVGSKEMVRVAGRPVIDHLVARMRAAGADEIRVVTRPDKGDLIAHLRAQGLATVLARPPTAAASTAAGLEGLGPDDAVLIGYPDTVWEPVDGFARMLDALRPPALAALGLFRTPDAARSDAVVVDDAGLVREIVVKSPSPPSDLIYGCAAVRRHVLEGLAHAGELGVHLAPLCRAGRVRGVALLGDFLDIGTPDALARARDL